MINSVKNKVKRDHALNRKNFILENINNIKEFQSKSFLNEDEQKRFKEILGEIDSEKDVLEEINDIDMLQEYLNKPIGKNKYIREFINDKITRLKKEKGNLDNKERMSVRSTSSKLSQLSKQTALSREDSNRISQIDSKLVLYSNKANKEDTDHV